MPSASRQPFPSQQQPGVAARHRGEHENHRQRRHGLSALLDCAGGVARGRDSVRAVGHGLSVVAGMRTSPAARTDPNQMAAAGNPWPSAGATARLASPASTGTATALSTRRVSSTRRSSQSSMSVCQALSSPPQAPIPDPRPPPTRWPPYGALYLLAGRSCIEA